MSTTDERNVDPIQEMARIAQDFLILPSRGFAESFRSSQAAKLIYNSEWCRISLIWGGWDYGGGNSVQIRYSRLHAPNEKTTMIWNGEECRCWHEFDTALYFLDGRVPKDVPKISEPHYLIKPFYETEFRQRYSRRQPEWLAEMHLTIWQHYGKRFFELFDLRLPDLWERYRQFLKELYDVQGRNPAIKPPKDKVC
jgi:hypothetical protein